MGLDMYLTKKVYIGANYEHNKVTGSINIKQGDTPIVIRLNKVVEITEEMGYWRKANAIHNWFVKNVQKGEDDCKEYYVSKDQLIKLLRTVKDVISDHSKAEELLPTTSGFFFGGTEYDEYYFDDLTNTEKIIEKALNEPNGNYYYHSSW